jgi:hypothetical protein
MTALTRSMVVAMTRALLASVLFMFVWSFGEQTVMAQGCTNFQFSCVGTNCPGTGIWCCNNTPWSWIQYYCWNGSEWVLRESQNGCCFYA